MGSRIWSSIWTVKDPLTQPLILIALELSEALYVYLAVSKQAVSVVLFRNAAHSEKIVYYMSISL